MREIRPSGSEGGETDSSVFPTPINEGPSSHIRPESCGDDREVVTDPGKRGMWTTVADTYSSLAIANIINTYVLSEWHSGRHGLTAAPY